MMIGLMRRMRLVGWQRVRFNRRVGFSGLENTEDGVEVREEKEVCSKM